MFLLLELGKEFEKLSRSKKQVILAGRIYSIRVHGGSTFIHFGDESAKIQAFFKKDQLGEKSYKFFFFLVNRNLISSAV